MPAPKSSFADRAHPAKSQPASPADVGSAAPAAFYQAGAYGLDDSWAYLMRQLLSASLRQVADALVDQDLPSVQWMPLLRLAAGQRCTGVALARDLGVDAATMTRAVDKLVAKGWVERQRCDIDRRQIELRITEAGQAMAAQLQPVLTQVLNGPLAGFSHADWQLLLGLLCRMKAAACQMAPLSCEADVANVAHTAEARVGKDKTKTKAQASAQAKTTVKAKPEAKSKAMAKVMAKSPAQAPVPSRKRAAALKQPVSSTEPQQNKNRRKLPGTG